MLGLRLLIVTVLLFFSSSVFATHLVGGEITWECLGNGQFQFQLKLFRDCSGQSPNNSEQLKVFNHPSISQIQVDLVQSNDLSPTCNGSSFDCSSGSGNATEEYVYESNPITISGVPPSEGFIITFNECCRNVNLTNIPNAGVAGMTLRAVMYPFNDTNLSTCYDSSPVFNYIPTTVFCTGQEVSFNNQVFDGDLDSLVYFFANPIDTLGVASCPTYTLEEPCVNILDFNTGYSVNSPLPDENVHPNNEAITLNTSIGEVSFKSNTTGRFITVLGVKSYKCGQLVSEVFREVQSVLINCVGGNDIPTVKIDQIDFLEDVYYDTVEVGDLVNLDLAFYFENITSGIDQVITLYAYGNQFGTGFNNPSSGCTNNSCATLLNVGEQASDSIKTTFSWQTSCSHVANAGTCENFNNTYLFHVLVKDDFCPMPGEKSITLAITVKAKDYSDPVSLICVSEDGDGSNLLDWSVAQDNGGSFSHYGIHHSHSLNGGYQEVPISDINQNQYEHVDVNLGTIDPTYYYVSTNSGCHGLDQSISDTISNVALTGNLLGSNILRMNWNQPYLTGQNTDDLTYIVERNIDNLNWVKIDTIHVLTYTDTVGVCGQNVSYRILYDLGSCTNMSTTLTEFLEDDLVPAVIDLDSLSYNGQGNLVMGWEASNNLDVKAYIVYLFNGTVWNPFDTVIGIDSTFYESISIGGSGVEKLRIAAMDSCSNTAPMGEVHESVFLSTAIDVCNEQLLMDWEDYVGWETDSLHIIGKKGSGADSVFITLTSGSEFTMDGLENNETYCFYLRAFGEGRSTRSNKVCVLVNWLNSPAYHFLSSVSVDTSNQIALELMSDPNASFTHFDIYHGRSIDDLSWFREVPKTDAAYYQIIDDENDPLLGSHYYYITGIDSCDRASDTTRIARTIDFRTRMNRSGSVELRFNSYINWLNGVETYSIIREVDGVLEGTPMTAFSSDNDSIYLVDSNNIAKSVCYILEASSYLNELDSISISRAMKSCTDSYTELFYFPTGFSPNDDGINDTFELGDQGFESDEFQFSIYNRAGHLVKDFSDPSDTWDGIDVNGSPSPIGVYVYFLKCIGQGGNQIEKMGHVSLIR